MFAAEEVTYVAKKKLNWGKILLVVSGGGLFVAGALYLAFAGGEPDPSFGDESSVSAPPSRQAAGTEVTPPSLTYLESEQEFNRQRQQESLERGTMVVRPQEVGTSNDVPATAPLETVNVERSVAPPPQITTPGAIEAGTAISDQEYSARIRYATDLIASWKMKPLEETVILQAEDTGFNAPPALGMPGEEASGQTPAVAAADDDTAARANAPIIQAGEFLYAESQSAANSEVPSAIRFDLIGHELGEAWVLANYERRGDYLDIKASLLIRKGHPAIPINAVVTGINGSPALRSTINRQFFKKYGLPAIARFIQGFGAAASTPQSTITINATDATQLQTEQLSLGEQALAGVGVAAETIANDLSAASGEVNPIVKLNANEPVSIFFLEDVYINRGQS